MKRVALHARHELDDPGIAHVLNEPVNNVVSKFTVRHLPAFEAQRGFHLVSALQETDCPVFLGLIVVLVHRHREFNLFDDDGFLFFPGCSLALVFFIEVLAVILDTTDGRLSCWRDFDQIQTSFPCNPQSFEWLKNSQLLACFVDYADLSRANTIIDAYK